MGFERPLKESLFPKEQDKGSSDLMQTSVENSSSQRFSTTWNVSLSFVLREERIWRSGQTTQRCSGLLELLRHRVEIDAHGLKEELGLGAFDSRCLCMIYVRMSGSLP
jgi:hypothetical protein